MFIKIEMRRVKSRGKSSDQTKVSIRAESRVMPHAEYSLPVPSSSRMVVNAF